MNASTGIKVTAALGLGSNLGDTKAAIASALSHLAGTPGITLLSRSSDYRTPPWGPVPQDDYRNCCVLIETTLSPKALLECCLAVEKRLGRVRDVRWGPRTIDIDVLLYAGVTVAEDDLILPHPRMSERAFVLVPLNEIWPDAPVGGGKTARQALTSCEGLDEIVRLDG